MKLISWNVNGIRACVQKGFLDFFHEADADIFCIQETKMQEGQLNLELERYHQYWNYAVKKGYSGTAVFTKKEPLSVSYGLGIEEHDQEGRVITCEFEDFYFVTVYTPNSQSELARLDYRMKWEDDFRAYLKKLDLQMKSVESSQSFLMQVSLILSGIFIPIRRGFIHGGRTGSVQERRMQAGGLTISACQNA